MSQDFKLLQEYLLDGDVEPLKEEINNSLEKGATPDEIINDGLLPVMSKLGEDFKNNTVFIPEVMIASRALNAGLDMLKPMIAGKDSTKGVGVIGTVKGDNHDIGKNIVRTMMEGKGIEMVDLGVDVSAEEFIAAAKENNAQLICCSSLLTSAMDEMGKVVELVKKEKLPVKVMIGGAVVSQKFCDQIGADSYTEDAYEAAETAARYCEELR